MECNCNLWQYNGISFTKQRNRKKFTQLVRIYTDWVSSFRLMVNIAVYDTLCRISLRGIWRWRRRALGSCGWRIWGRFHLSVSFADSHTVAAKRFPGPDGPAHRAASSKPARFFRRWRRFAVFPLQGRHRERLPLRGAVSEAD